MTKKEVEQLIVNGKLTLITDCIACGKILLLHITQMNELGEDVLVCPKVKDSLFSIYKEETVYKRIEGLLGTGRKYYLEKLNYGEKKG